MPENYDDAYREFLSMVCRLALAALAFAPACGREMGAGQSTGPGVTSVSISYSSTDGTSSASSTSTGSSEDSSAGSSGSGSGSDDRFDMGVMPDFGPAAARVQGEDRLSCS
jgi:hypothetical protein